MRDRPNIIVTGTPGVGKSTHCEVLTEKTGLKHLSINDVVKTKECHEGWDKEFHSWIVDEDKLLDAIESDVQAGGCIIDWHACDLFPTRWIDLVVVLRADSTTLYDRLIQRNYPESKLQENIDSEIMDVLIEEARSAFDDEIVVELSSTSTDEMESNITRILKWIEQWEKSSADRADIGSEDDKDQDGGEDETDSDVGSSDGFGGDDTDEDDEHDDEKENKEAPDGRRKAAV